jgi:A/G-specific adenine glycosylase
MQKSFSRNMRHVIGDENQFARRLLRWYRRHRRDLPWRRARGSEKTLDPYHVLVSEAMLQQTQVATVVPYFNRFIGRFPTLASLADAPEQDVLRLWQGLGYYSRARNLQRAAREIIDKYGGEMPATADALRTLPGVGRYTAGAVASIAFDCRSPIVDGNVARVICRIDKIESDPREKTTLELIWKRAEEILPQRGCGDFNSALMELGAIVCTPRSPKCLICPVRAHCEAQAAGVQEQIPPPRKAKATPLLRRDVLCIQRDSRWLIEQRPQKGRWAGMWQFITRPRERSNPKDGRRIGVVTHALTHRRYHYRVFISATDEVHQPNGDTPKKWVTLAELDAYPLPRPHLKIVQMLQSGPLPPRGGGLG